MKPTKSGPSPSSIPLSISVGGLALLFVIGGLIVWGSIGDTPRYSPATQPSEYPQTIYSDELEPLVVRATVRSRSDVQKNHEESFSLVSAIHSYSLHHENGKKIIRLKVLAEGDELVIDATTGKLIEHHQPKPILTEASKIIELRQGKSK